MKRIWGWVSELFVSAPAKPSAVRTLRVVETPAAPWSLAEVNELRWA